MARSHLAAFEPGNSRNTVLRLAAEALGIPIADTKQGKTSGSYYDGSRPEFPAGNKTLFSMVADRVPVPARKPVLMQADNTSPADNYRTARRVSSDAVEKIKTWEGLKTKAYYDQGDVWTIGYGHTGRSGGIVPYEGMVISPEQAVSLLADDLNVAAKDVEQLVKVPLNDNQYAALASFFLNMGNKQSTRNSTFLKQLNAGDYSAIEREFPKWIWYTDTKDNQKRQSDGLLDRRKKEIELWKTPVK